MLFSMLNSMEMKVFTYANLISINKKESALEYGNEYALLQVLL